ncbi:unnamed protein product [Sphenostylis stenocarpa]|uniref:Uncharacterized protein n=1 Tax=Sphenostylis stenocarpa TaxID=92480 RepID=A0AA86SR38_9FABA|nr:unnamed protein product [Sphenostylis stenocarpa]
MEVVVQVQKNQAQTVERNKGRRKRQSTEALGIGLGCISEYHSPCLRKYETGSFKE